MTYYYPKCENGNCVVEQTDKYNPFVLDSSALHEIKHIVPANMNPLEKANKIFSYFVYNFAYDRHASNCALDLFRNRKGCCKDMSLAYSAALRVHGIESYYVHVSVDNKGKYVNHVCSSVHLDSQMILTDVAYMTFDAKHFCYQIKEDHSVFGLYPESKAKTIGRSSVVSSSESILDMLKPWHFGAVAAGSLAVFLMMEAIAYPILHKDYVKNAAYVSKYERLYSKQECLEQKIERNGTAEFFNMIRKGGPVDKAIEKKISNGFCKLNDKIADIFKLNKDSEGDEDDE